MTRQEAILRVRDYLTRPGARRAFDPAPTGDFPEGVCRYETVIDGETHNCAVGCLLAREDLDRSMATFVGSVADLFATYGIPNYLLELGEDEGDFSDQEQSAAMFLGGLQAVHDNEANWRGGKFDVGALSDFAENYDLTLNP